MSAEVLLSRLEGVRRTGHNRWRAPCPGHGSKGDSLSIGVAEDDGRVLLHCFGGCSIDEVLRAVGLSVTALFPGNMRLRHERQPRIGIHPMDALACLIHDVRIVQIAATDIRNGVGISSDDWRAFDEAVGRIRSVEALVHG